MVSMSRRVRQMGFYRAEGEGTVTGNKQTNTLNVKHPSLEFIGTGLTEVKSNVLTRTHKTLIKLLEVFSTHTVTVEYFGKVAKVRNLSVRRHCLTGQGTGGVLSCGLTLPPQKKFSVV